MQQQHTNYILIHSRKREERWATRLVRYILLDALLRYSQSIELHTRQQRRIFNIRCNHQRVYTGKKFTFQPVRPYSSAVPSTLKRGGSYLFDQVEKDKTTFQATQTCDPPDWRTPPR